MAGSLGRDPARIREPDEGRLALAESNLDRILEWITRLDARILALFALNVGMTGYLISHSPSWSMWRIPMWVAVTTFGLAQGVSLLLLLGAYVPRLSAQRESLFYFGTISSMKGDDFSEKFLESPTRELALDILSQCHRNAAIVRAKFDALRWATLATATSALPWITALLFIADG